MHRPPVTPLLTLLLLAAPPLLAEAPQPAPQPQMNDARFGGRSTDLLPLKATPLHLRAVEVQLVEVPVKDGWEVTATYDLHNPGPAAAGAQLLLAEERCPAGRQCTPMAGVYQDLGTRLGPDLIEPTAAPADVVRQHADPAGAGYLYAVSVPPRQSRRLVQEYRLDLSQGQSFWGIQHVSSAGRWGGPVAQARYVVELKRPTPYVIAPRQFKLTEFVERPNDRGAGTITRLVFTAEGLSARSDFFAVFPADALVAATPSGPCPGFRGELPQAELASALGSYTPERLRACRDLVYALHGYPFKEPEKRARFYGAPPSPPPWAGSKLFTLSPRPESRGFREALLGPGERAYVQALAEAERRRKK